jgi:hypothetical protein
VLRVSVSNWSTDDDDVALSVDAVRRAAGADGAAGHADAAGNADEARGGGPG